MSKKKLDLAKDLTRGRSIKKELGATEEAATKMVKKVVKKLPEEIKVSEPVPTKTEDKKLVRTTIDLPAYVHKAIKIKAATEGISLKNYLVSLVKNDLKLD